MEWPVSQHHLTDNGRLSTESDGGLEIRLQEI